MTQVNSLNSADFKKITKSEEITQLEHEYCILIQNIISLRQNLDSFLIKYEASTFRGEVYIEVIEKIEKLSKEADDIIALIDSLE